MPIRRSISRPTSKTPRSKTALVRSIANPRREASVLRRARERLEEEPRPDHMTDNSAIVGRRATR